MALLLVSQDFNSGSCLQATPIVDYNRNSFVSLVNFFFSQEYYSLQSSLKPEISSTILVGEHKICLYPHIYQRTEERVNIIYLIIYVASYSMHMKFNLYVCVCVQELREQQKSWRSDNDFWQLALSYPLVTWNKMKPSSLVVLMSI